MLAQLLLSTKVTDLDPQDQKLLAPVLKSPVLRQLLVAMSTPPATQHETNTRPTANSQQATAALNSWLSNPRVLQLLREAARALRKGVLTEAQLVKLLQQEVDKARGLCGSSHSVHSVVRL